MRLNNIMLTLLYNYLNNNYTIYNYTLSNKYIYYLQ